MKQPSSTWTLAIAATAAVAMCATQPLQADLVEKTKKVGGTMVHYKIVLPNGYDPATAYPGILVLGGGPQTMNTVDSTLGRNFRAEAEKRGYIVVAPAAPSGVGISSPERRGPSPSREVHKQTGICFPDH